MDEFTAPLESKSFLTRAEIGFAHTPDGASALAAVQAVSALDGIVRVRIDACVRRVAILFDPQRVDIPAILTALEPFSPNSRVVSVALLVHPGYNPVTEKLRRLVRVPSS